MAGYRVGVAPREIADIAGIAYVLPKSGYLVPYNVDDDASEVMLASVRHMHRRPLPKQRRK